MGGLHGNFFIRAPKTLNPFQFLVKVLVLELTRYRENTPQLLHLCMLANYIHASLFCYLLAATIDQLRVALPLYSFDLLLQLLLQPKFSRSIQVFGLQGHYPASATEKLVVHTVNLNLSLDPSKVIVELAELGHAVVHALDIPGLLLPGTLSLGRKLWPALLRRKGSWGCHPLSSAFQRVCPNSYESG